MTDDAARDIWSIRKMSQAYNVTPRTLRFYEEKELLFPRREGQTRLYGRNDRARLKLILRGKRYGFCLEDIRQLLNLYGLSDGKFKQMKRLVEIGKARLVALENDMVVLEKTIMELKEYLAWGEEEIRKSTPASSRNLSRDKDLHHATILPTD